MVSRMVIWGFVSEMFACVYVPAGTVEVFRTVLNPVRAAKSTVTGLEELITVTGVAPPSGVSVTPVMST